MFRMFLAGKCGSPASPSSKIRHAIYSILGANEFSNSMGLVKRHQKKAATQKNKMQYVDNSKVYTYSTQHTTLIKQNKPTTSPKTHNGKPTTNKTANLQRQKRQRRQTATTKHTENVRKQGVGFTFEKVVHNDVHRPEHRRQAQRQTRKIA